MVLTGENSDVPNLLNEERALRARLAEIQTKKSSIQPAPLQQIRDDRAKTQNERELQKVREKEQAEAQELFESDPVAYANKYLGGVEWFAPPVAMAVSVAMMFFDIFE